jgi:hypothetical protein
MRDKNIKKNKKIKKNPTTFIQSLKNRKKNSNNIYKIVKEQKNKKQIPTTFI